MVKVVDGFKSFPVWIEQDSKTVDHEWVVESLGLNAVFSPDSMASSDQGGERRSESRGGRWPEVMDNRVDIRVGQNVRDSDNLVNRKFKKGGSMDKGKRTYVRSAKMKTSHPHSVCGKLELEKKISASCRAESWSSSTNSDLEEGQLKNFGLFKGECSKVKSVGFGPKIDGLKQTHGKKVVGGLQFDGELYCGFDGSSESNSKSSEIKSITFRGHIQLPLRDKEGTQIRGKYFLEVPITVELTGLERSNMIEDRQRAMSSENQNIDPRNVRFYWNLEEEITKVIEKGVALGHC
ncbi:hypothetical protein LWI29_025553 [Acer saccharum]|uniref:Uncharacterized protein n=1 Tax=Acer saccharum TaxID=4024 RepID=A0AA39SGG4_ACESA|nr:hypothetical protein LWI29_025553 [Acer saccharum]